MLMQEEAEAQTDQHQMFDERKPRSMNLRDLQSK